MNCLKLSPVEKFMADVAEILGVEPSFIDPSLSGGNSAIKERLDKLLQYELVGQAEDALVVGKLKGVD